LSKGGDDAEYIVRAHSLITDFAYPTFQGPLYPFVLSVFVWIFGISLPLLKFLSVLFAVGQFYFIFKTYHKNIIPGAIFYTAFFLTATNAYVLYYASQTYSEALFMLIQSILVYYFIRNFIEGFDEGVGLNNNYKKYLITGLLIFLAGMTRSVGYAGLGAIVLYLLIQRQWRSAGFISLSLGFFYGLFDILKRLIWNFSESQFKLQADQLLLKDPYYPEKGTEDLAGFAMRFIDNSQIYLSKYFFIYIGFRPDITNINTTLTIFVFILFGLALFWAFKKNKTILFTGIYVGVMFAVTFFMLQTRWDSSRLVVTYFPFVMVFIFSGLYYLLTFKQFKDFQFIYILFIIIVLMVSLNRTGDKVIEQIPVIKHNLQGDKYYGLTPDWINYIQMAEWVGNNIPPDAVVASRKPSIDRIYGNRKFLGIYRVPNENPDSLLANLKKNNVKYVMVGSLRKYEQKKTEFVINTIHRYLYFIQTKYPNAIRQIHQIGNDEASFLFEIQYPDTLKMY
jgi:hypothetical protein